MSILIDYDPQAVTPRPTGLIRGIVSNITDMGIKPDPFHEGSTKHQIAITWQLERTWTDKTGKQLPLQQTELYNLTLHEKGKLRPIIEGVLGKSLGPINEKITGFDIESLIGKSCVLTIRNQPGNEKYTEVQACAPLMAGMLPMTIVPMPVAQWILDLRDGKGKAKEASTEFNLDSAVKNL